MAAKLKSDPHLEIAHVLFVDVVGYSKLLVNEQRAVIEEINQLVRKTPQFRKSERGGKLIRIPSGDGMALVFFQTPEEPVQCAMEIARALKNQPHIRLRMGAIQQLEELLPLYGPISYGQLKLHPWWDPLRDNPRFERIVEEARKPVALS